MIFAAKDREGLISFLTSDGLTLPARLLLETVK